MRERVLERKNSLREKRKKRVRGKIFGTAQKPRVTIFRSNRYLYAQAIDDTKGITLASIDGHKMGLGNTKEDAKKIAASFGEILKSKNIDSIVFDRNGYLYHGVVATFADALREIGIKF